MRFRSLVAVALVLCLASAAAAQFGRGFGFGFRSRFPPRFPKADTFGTGFNFCRGIYTSTRGEAGGQGWSTDYPDADLNFSIRLSELTRTRVKFDAEGRPDYVTVRLTDDALFQCPYLHMEDVGTVTFSPREVEALRAYLKKGGFLWVDDFWGEAAWAQWSRELAKAMPPPEYTIEDVPLTDPIFHSMLEVKRVPQVSGIGFWRATAGRVTSERGEESAVVHFRAIRDAHGRIIAVMTHNTDVTNSWERETEDPAYFLQFSVEGYALGIDVLLYAMTH